eukprot:COSAG06_NODE_30220_length_542_cov_2.009029_1_plen_119_part_10
MGRRAGIPCGCIGVQLETAVGAAKSAAADVSSAVDGKVASVESKVAELESAVQCAAGSSELDAKVKELSNAMRTSLTDFETKVGELNARFDQLQQSSHVANATSTTESDQSSVQSADVA